MSVEETEVQSAEDVFLGLLTEEDAEAPQDGQAEAPEQEVEEQPADDEGEELEASGEESDEEAETEEVESDQDEPALYEVKGPSGQIEQVTLEDLQNGWMMRSDYTQKTQANAERERELEAKVKQFEEDRKVVEQQIYDRLALLNLEENEPDWAEESELDPIGWSKKKYEWDQKKAAREKVMQEQQTQYMIQRKQHIDVQQKRLVELIPDMGVPQKRAELANQINSFLIKDMGLPEQEVINIVDANMILIAKLAMDQFNQAKTSEIVRSKKLVNKPKVVKPGAARPKSKASSFDKTLDAYAKEQTTDNLAEVFKSIEN